MKDRKVFLEANWERLVSLNYAVDPQLLEKHLPKGTELEKFNDKCYVSLVAFRYSDTKLLKVKVPFYQQFEEVNLRFYIRRKIGVNKWRSEVAFTKLYFPKRALSFVANRVYKENYETRKMKHKWTQDDTLMRTAYSVKKDQWHHFEVVTERRPQKIQPDSAEHFFAKHYWGTAQIDASSCTAYMIEHPPWSTHNVIDFSVDVNFGTVFGPEFEMLSTQKPESVQLYDGSPVVVFKRTILR